MKNDELPHQGPHFTMRFSPKNFNHIIEIALSTLRKSPPDETRELANTVLSHAEQAEMVENATLTSIRIYVDLTTTHVTLDFNLPDGPARKCGPHLLTDDLLRTLSHVVDEPEVLKMTDKPCRVRLRNGGVEIIGVGHFLREEWLVFPTDVCSPNETPRP